MKRLFNTFILLLLGGVITAQSNTDNCSDDRAYLGIYTQRVSEVKAALLQLPQEEGSLITEVMIGGAADKAGLQPFDYIYGIDDYRTDSWDNLTDLLHRYKAGDQADVHLIRNGRPMTVNLTFGRQSDSSRRKRGKGEVPFLGISNRGSKDDETGIKVGIVEHSTAEDLGLRSGDKILTINGFPMIDWSDVTTAIGMLEVGDEITVTYDREGDPMQVSGPIRSRTETDEIQEYRSSAESAFLGIYSNTISVAKAKKLGFENPYGSYVSGVIGNTAAERANIQPFDYIYGVDQYRTGEGQDLTDILQKYEVGDQATVHFVRRTQEREVGVTFGSRNDRRLTKVDKCDEPFLGVQSSHSYVERTGVSVAIVDNSTAQNMGMEDHDLITRINGYPIIDWSDIATAIDNMTVGATIEVNWVRSGREMKERAAIMSYCQTKTNQIVPDPGSSLLSRRSVDQTDLRNVTVQVADVNSQEAREMQRLYQVSLNTENQLGIRSIRIATQPTKGKFQLSFELPDQGKNVEVKIYNNLGRSIYDYENVSFTGSFSDEVDLSQNGIGTYYLHVRQNGKSASKRLILQKG